MNEEFHSVIAGKKGESLAIHDLARRQLFCCFVRKSNLDGVSELLDDRAVVVPYFADNVQGNALSVWAAGELCAGDLESYRDEVLGLVQYKVVGPHQEG